MKKFFNNIWIFILTKIFIFSVFFAKKTGLALIKSRKLDPDYNLSKQLEKHLFTIKFDSECYSDSFEVKEMHKKINGYREKSKILASGVAIGAMKRASPKYVNNPSFKNNYNGKRPCNEDI